ncbi:MAG: DNA cytosine methyltransferase [Solirubrobacterales bacterium]
MDRTQTRRRRTPQRLAAAEFFAGIGLVRAALNQNNVDVVFANDIEPSKHQLYAENFGDHDFVLGDVRAIEGADIPRIDLATASFPCTDLSLAGGRAGLDGESSSMFWEFARILEEMPDRPQVVLLENVPGFATSRDGRDLRAAIERLNELGYACDLLAVDAKYFVPQSRQRLFIVGFQGEPYEAREPTPTLLRPRWLMDFINRNPDLDIRLQDIEEPPARDVALSDVVERLRPDDVRWWDAERTDRFVGTLSPIQSARLAAMRDGEHHSWATAYRRTRNGVAVWEIRADGISGCLRTARGGSSRQALVEAGSGEVRVRWMTPREYARLQGADDFRLAGASDNQVLFGFGDAVCVPAVSWLIENHVIALLEAGSRAGAMELAASG